MSKKINLGFAALLAGFGLIATQSAFTAKTLSYYHYKTTNGPVAQTSSWEPAAAPTTFECSGDPEVPCTIGIETPLSTYLSGKDNQAVMDSPELISSREQ
ncbi:hypothetical protein ASE74_24230 [Pedobacter sp. Leaf216]|uniref:hypothetical protein n=1 Tax=Pedobacter sp. Leaf216 TaxID=1735684 RepID=UPI00070158AA|nr:hypothetical protein [Pedobacter sp. Leaf216]KQM68202.1 hypothetical protein ASE74_24230 [Pedobacter sp. Leaf216]